MKPLLAIIALAVGGCATFKPLAGGGTGATLGGLMAPTSATLKQPQNPETASTQVIKRTESRTYGKAPSPRRAPQSYAPSVLPQVEANPAPEVITETVTEEVTSTVGASQKDTSREIAAKMASMRPVQMFGVLLLVVAAAMFHPIVKGFVGAGKDMQMWVAVAGLVCVFGPQLLAGNERMLLIGAMLGLAGLYLSTRLSYKNGLLDANKNGIPDKDETKA